TSGLDLSRRLGDVALDLAFLGQQRAMGVAIERTVTHQLERSLSLTEPSHRVRDASGSETGLGDDEPVTPTAEDRILWHLHVAVADLTMVSARVSHGGDDPFDVVARRVRRYEDDRELAVLAGVR